MIPHLPSTDVIKRMSDPISYLDGMRYFSTGKLGFIRRQETPGLDYECDIYDASRTFHTGVELLPTTITTSCTCVNKHPSQLCSHVVALLLALHELENASVLRGSTPAPPLPPPPTPRSLHYLTERLVNAFRDANRSTSPVVRLGSSPLLVEVGLTVLRDYHHETIGFSLKMGEKRLQYVPKIMEFLSEWNDRSPYVISKTLTVDPARHAIPMECLEFIHELQVIAHKSDVVAASGNYYNIPYGSQHRYLVIPALAFDVLLPYLRKIPVSLEHSRPLTISDNTSLPVKIALTASPDHHYEFRVSGLSQVTFLPAYGMAIAGSTLYPLEDTIIRPLSSMKKMTATSDNLVLPASKADLEPILEHVIPALKKVSEVEIAKEIANRVVEEPMQGQLYLDIQNGALVAEPRFKYGKNTIKALQSENKKTSSDGIIIRDTTAEDNFLARLHAAEFIPEGDRLYLRQEDAQFTFLMDHLPQLQNDYQVYLTESLDPIVHGSFPSARSSVDLTSNMNWLEVTFDIDGIDAKEARALLRSVIEKKRYHRLRDGAFVPLNAPGFRELGTLMEDLDVSAKELRQGNKIQLPALRGLNLIDQTDRSETVAVGRSLRRFLDNLKHPDNIEVDPPASLTSTLRDYQRFGFQWMATLNHYGFGGILADDMGLGKTLQSIAFILAEREKGPFDHPALIVCPASLMFNWEHEIARFAPSLNTRIVTGTRDEREAMMQDLTDVDVLITSYPLLRRDTDLFTGPTYHALIIDEAQAIKNHATQTAQAVASLESPRRYALTGTPIENSLDDLWSILHTVFPTLFSNREAFRRLPPEMIARRVRPFLLRRLKRDVLKELPDKIETTELADLTTPQKTLYLGYLEELRKATSQELEESDFQKSRFKILAGLTRLRQICCHPGMFAENYSGGSGKLELLLEIIDEALASQKKMLIFSQFTSMLAIIKKELEGRGHSYFYLDGETPVKDRLTLTEQFNHGDRPIFLISLKAGGTGLNLTGADTVILYDLWWNPAVEEQAADRAHRIGQRNVVQVIRLITEGTIEEKMYELQQKKRDLVSQVIQANEEGLSSLSEEDVRELLAL